MCSTPKFACVALCLVCFTALAVGADRKKVRVQGTIKDTSGMPVGGQKVTFESTDPVPNAPAGKRGPKTPPPPPVVSVTDKDGHFETELFPGGYYMTCGSDSLGWIYESIIVEADKPLSLNQRLSK
ncbi:MAG: carboxypeptidase-like regulatory domain-containing protein [Tepidisphaeraceae bacterium]